MDFDSAGPAPRIRMLEQANVSPDSAISFLNTGVQVNALRQAQGSLRCGAAGVQRWASLCDLLGVAYFPRTSTPVLRWGALFNPSRTFVCYVARLSKAFHLLNITHSCHNASAGVGDPRHRKRSRC